MATSSVTEFFDRLEKDPALQAALEALITDDDRTVSGEQMVEFAGSHGYEFTLEELGAAVGGSGPAETDGELSDAELEEAGIYGAGGEGLGGLGGSSNCMMNCLGGASGGSGDTGRMIMLSVRSLRQR